MNKFSLVRSPFFQIRRNFELIFRFMSSQLRKFERRLFFFCNEYVQSFICIWDKIYVLVCAQGKMILCNIFRPSLSRDPSFIIAKLTCFNKVK